MTAAVELPASDPPPSVASLPLGRLSYVDEGPRRAPALVALHGIPGSVRDFRYLAPQLTDRIRMVRLDLPGFGGSPPVDDAVRSFRGRAAAVLALADHLGLSRFSVLGHSMGGGTALAVAAAHPGRVDLLALVASVALSRHRGLGMAPWVFGLAARCLRLPVLGRGLLAWTRAGYRRRRLPGADELTASDLAVQMQAIAAADFGFLRRAVAGPLPRTLVAYARDDHMIEPWISEELVRALPDARVLAFDEGGHNLQKTRAVELAAALRDCLGIG